MGYIIWSIEFQVLTLKKVLTSKSLILQKRKKKERLPRVFGHDVLSFEMSLVMKLMLLLKYAIYILVFTIDLAIPWKGGQGLAQRNL